MYITKADMDFRGPRNDLTKGRQIIYQNIHI